jgi:hypothetical protein
MGGLTWHKNQQFFLKIMIPIGYPPGITGKKIDTRQFGKWNALKVQASISFFKMPYNSFCSRSMCAHTLKIQGGGFHGVINDPITPNSHLNFHKT